MAHIFADKKIRLTASVRKSLVKLIDHQAGMLDMSRSALIEQAVALWLCARAEQEQKLALKGNCEAERVNDFETFFQRF